MNEIQILEIPCGKGGLNYSRTISDFPVQDLQYCENITFEDDTWQKEGGASKINTTTIAANESILGLHDFWLDSETQIKIAGVSNGIIVSFDTDGIVDTLKSGLAEDKQIVFVESLGASTTRKLFAFNGHNQPQVTSDGETCTNIGADGIDAPGACTAALAGDGAGNVDDGTHSYKITFVNSHGETEGGTTSNVVTVADKGADGKVALTGIPVSTSSECTSRKIYRTVAGDTGSHKLVDTLSDNTTTTYTDNTADASLGANVPTGNTALSVPADWTGTSQPAGGVAHNGRMWAWLDHNVYYSTRTNHEDFQQTGSGIFACYPGEGEKIVAGWSFAGRLYLWKYPQGIYWIDDSDPTVTNWELKRLTKSVGMAGPLGLAQTDSDIIFVAPDGLIHALSAVTEYGDVKSSAILPDKIAGFAREKIKISRLQWANAIFYPTKREWHLAHTGSGYSYNNQQLILDLHDMKNVRYRFVTRDVCESMALIKDSNDLQRPMIGDNAGFVRILDESNRNKDGSPYTAKYRTGDIAFIGEGMRRANLQFIEIIFKPEGSHTLTVEVYLDGKYTQTVSMDMGSATGGSLGSFILGTDTLGGGNIFNTRRKLVGDCRRIQLVGYNSGLNENFSISSHLIGYTIGNERPS